MTGLEQLRKRYPTLSILERSGPGCLTFYEGISPAEDLAHLKGGGVLCSMDLELPDGVPFTPLRVDSPRLQFYRISALYRNDAQGMADLVFDPASGAFVSRDCHIGRDVVLGPGSVVRGRRIGDGVKLGSNVVIHSNVILHERVVVESSSVIGATGVVWMWHENQRVYLEQTGGVEIDADTFIGSNITVVRGGPNSITRIGRNCCIAHGTMIGHDCQIADLVHMANNVALGGGVAVGARSFLGSGSAVVPKARIGCDVILGAGAVLTKSAESFGVYQGNPARWVKRSKGQLAGVPRWRA